MHKNILVIIFVFFALVLGMGVKNVYFHPLDREFSDDFIGRYPDNLSLTSQKSLRQEFVATHNFLYRVGVTVFNPYVNNTGTLHLTLMNGPEVIAKDSLNISALSSVRFSQLIFQPIEDSKDKKFILTVETDTSPEFPLSVFYGPKRVNSSESLAAGENVIDHRLTLIAGYVNPYSTIIGWRGMKTLLDRVSQYKPVISKGASLIVLSIVLFIMSFVFLYYYCTLHEDDNSDSDL